MNAKKEFEVLKWVTVNLSTNEEDLIFIDTNGKIYFIDRKNKEGYKDLSIGDKVMVWVRKEFEKVGYVSLMVDGITVENFIKKLPELTMTDYTWPNRTNVVQLSNYFYNHDSRFNKTLGLVSEPGGIIGPYKNTTDACKRILTYYDARGINSEIDEFNYELAVLHTYLFNVYTLDK